jgi:hypothetical protein
MVEANICGHDAMVTYFLEDDWSPVTGRQGRKVGCGLLVLRHLFRVMLAHEMPSAMGVTLKRFINGSSTSVHLMC